MKLSIFIATVSFGLLFGGCRKSDNPRLPELERAPLPLITKAAGGDVNISKDDPAAFTGKFTVDMYFKSDIPPKQVDIIAIKNLDSSNQRVLQANITSFPTTVSVTGQQLIDLFGEPLVLGDKIDLGVTMTLQDGTKLEAFPAIGTNYAPGIFAQPGVSVNVRYAVVCPFVIADYESGDFEVVSDEWEDYSAGDDIDLTVIDDTTMSFEYLADDALPIILKIDPATNAITVDKQLYGNYGGDDYFAETLPGSGSIVDPCDVSLSVKLHHTTAAGSGDATIVIRKKP